MHSLGNIAGRSGVAPGVVLSAPVVVLSVLLAGCSVSRAPFDWLPNVEDVPEDAFGAWVEIEQSDTTRYGELIAVDSFYLYVLPVAPRDPRRSNLLDSLAAGRLDTIPRSAIRAGRLYWFDSDWERLALMSLAGTAGSLSHGAALIISWPFWIIGGFVSSSTRSKEPLLEYPGSTWDAWTAYARFPQGMPPGVDRLRPRPPSGNSP